MWKPSFSVGVSRSPPVVFHNFSSCKRWLDLPMETHWEIEFLTYFILHIFPTVSEMIPNSRENPSICIKFLIKICLRYRLKPCEKFCRLSQTGFITLYLYLHMTRRRFSDDICIYIYIHTTQFHINITLIYSYFHAYEKNASVLLSYVRTNCIIPNWTWNLWYHA